MDSDDRDGDLQSDVRTRASLVMFFMVVLCLLVVAVLCVTTLARG
ncbi:MAG: hypothetical protein JWO46_3295 [Nocardioidaceae bacterium]|nr:hypothetical protein [Nocardioidaceae bacterium]